jgi:hypothetical protein
MQNIFALERDLEAWMRAQTAPERFVEEPFAQQEALARLLDSTLDPAVIALERR